MYRVGNFVIVGNSGANYLYGQITSFTGTSAVVNVLAAFGSGGPYNSWSFSLQANPGATGPTGATGIQGATGLQGATGVSATDENIIAYVIALS